MKPWKLHKGKRSDCMHCANKKLAFFSPKIFAKKSDIQHKDPSMLAPEEFKKAREEIKEKLVSEKKISKMSSEEYKQLILSRASRR